MDSGFTHSSMPRFLSTDDLAAFLGISKTTVYRLIEKRTLPFYKIGGSLRFKENEVMEFVERQRVKPSNEQYERT